MKTALFESDQLLADLISFRLELLGHNVMTFESPDQGFAGLEKGNFDLIIVDTCQPIDATQKTDQRGLELIQKIRTNYNDAQLPMLAVSIATDLTLVEKAVQAGANDYLIVPFDPAALQEKTDALLLGKHLETANAR